MKPPGLVGLNASGSCRMRRAEVGGQRHEALLLQEVDHLLLAALVGCQEGRPGPPGRSGFAPGRDRPARGSGSRDSSAAVPSQLRLAEHRDLLRVERQQVDVLRSMQSYFVLAHGREARAICGRRFEPVGEAVEGRERARRVRRRRASTLRRREVRRPGSPGSSPKRLSIARADSMASRA